MDQWRVEVLNDIARAEVDALPQDIRAPLTHVIVHAFVKKTQKTPPQAIRLALKRAKELES